MFGVGAHYYIMFNVRAFIPSIINAATAIEHVLAQILCTLKGAILLSSLNSTMGAIAYSHWSFTSAISDQVQHGVSTYFNGTIFTTK